METKERTLDVTVEVKKDGKFTVSVLDNESGCRNSFDDTTTDISEKIGEEILSWVTLMQEEAGNMEEDDDQL